MKGLTKEQGRKLLLCLAVLLGVFLLIILLDVACVFRLVTGVPCPGCGMTRAHLAALRLDFASAFHWHPLWMLPIPLALSTVWRPQGITRRKKLEQGILLALAVLVFLVYLWRMVTLFPDTPPMDYYEMSLFGRLIGLLR